MNILERAYRQLDLAIYKDADNSTLISNPMKFNVPEEQYILRMMVRHPEMYGRLAIPPELAWIAKPLVKLVDSHDFIFPENPYIYITVRSGEVRSVTDDEWHVDGFSMRKEHLPEQNYIWSNCFPTEVLDQQFTIPDDFDPMRHNLHKYFQDNANNSKIRLLKPNYLYTIDPYVVHRRPQVPIGTKRSFIRISFVPIEIEDDTCTPNPLLPRKIYNRSDIRQKLISYN